jgi:hypothetical protein
LLRLARICSVLITVMLFTYADLLAQKTVVSGVVLDDTGIPMPSVNVSFQGTIVGTITDINGQYFIETNKPSDTIQASFFGFKQVEKLVIKGEEQVVDVELIPELEQLDDVVITANRRDKNPAVTFMNKVVDAKSDNDIYAQEYVEYKVYGKVELDLNKLDEEFQDRKVMQRFGFMFEADNEGDSNSKPYIPVIYAENLSEYYYRKFPKDQKEVIVASRISGVKNESVHEQLANIYLKINLYDDFLDIFTKGFVSPLSSTGNLFYKYYIVDSLSIKGDKCLHLKVNPRREGY